MLSFGNYEASVIISLLVVVTLSTGAIRICSLKVLSHRILLMGLVPSVLHLVIQVGIRVLSLLELGSGPTVSRVGGCRSSYASFGPCHILHQIKLLLKVLSAVLIHLTMTVMT